MPDNTKPPRPKIKVEEITEEPEEIETPKPTKESSENVAEVKPKDEEVAKVPESTSQETPKITSFSQLDSQKSSDTASATEDTTKPTESVLTPETPKKEEGLSETEKSTEKASKEKEDVSSDEIKEWLKEVRPDTTKEVEKKGGPNTKLIVLVVIILLVLGAVVGGVLYYRQSVTTEPSGETPETQETSTPAPTQTPEEEVDISTLSLSLLNGSGTVGEAGKAKDLLIEAGFMEDKLTTGNAQSYDYTSTSISLKKGLSEKVFEEIKKALEGTYEVVKSETTLEEDSTYDVIIIVGKKK